MGLNFFASSAIGYLFWIVYERRSLLVGGKVHRRNLDQSSASKKGHQE
ncbi:hypothetical protein HanXRQr2_Chr03g0097601 [Helianthus annuus]|uniref:Uncharacterized protein n=1 Tax=Helianthus annuus TaxID=4232 RepID=A0A9K3JEB1_HELAN|nr:hypothetical protein HanXRQr2_Chr03g0097601 [Helianthus annuus]